MSSKEASFVRTSQLFRLLCERLPEKYKWQHPHHRAGQIAVVEIARVLNQSGKSVFRWCRNNSISKKGARKLIDISEGALDWPDMVKFF